MSVCRCRGNGCVVGREGGPRGPAEAFGFAIFLHTNAICVELAESAPSGGERSEFVIHTFRQKYHFVALPFTYKHMCL